MPYSDPSRTAAASRKHYLNNRPKRLASAKKSRDKNKLIIREYIRDYLCMYPCIDCGEHDLVVLEFDHRDPAIKSFNIGSATNGHSLAAVIAEIAKCDVRCANCHRRKTYEERGLTHKDFEC